MAVCLTKLRDFSTRDFAKYHPGGALGKKLYVRVGDLLHKEKPLVSPETNLKEVIIEISSNRLGATAVVENGLILGVITDGDLRRMLGKGIDLHEVKAKEIMSPNPKSIDISALAAEALLVMEESSITQLLVKDGDTYVGVVHLHDILKEGIL